MSSGVVLPHFYAVLGDGRLNIIGSQDALLEFASALASSASDGRPRNFLLTRTEMPHYGMSLATLSCRRTDAPLLCVVERGVVQVSGDARGLLHLVSALQTQAEAWHGGGHTHVYSGWNWEPDGAVVVSSDSEELLIGGHGYLPNEMFGLVDEQ